MTIPEQMTAMAKPDVWTLGTDDNFVRASGDLAWETIPDDVIAAVIEYEREGLLSRWPAFGVAVSVSSAIEAA
jgi:hypothetical protein